MNEPNKFSSAVSHPGTAVVTGASSGLGKVYADRLAGRGYNLILVARRAGRLEALAAELKQKYNVVVTSHVADLAHPAELESVAAAIAADESITLLVNNAGTTHVRNVAESAWQDIDNMIQLNVTALTRLTRAVLPGFTQRDRGILVNIGSIVSFYSFPSNSVYSGTKAYVLNLTRGLQAELKDTNVQVQFVAPAATESEIWEIGGMPLSSLPPEVVMTAEDCVDAALEGMDLKEPMTLPSLHDAKLLADYETNATNVLYGAQTGKPAPRYLEK